MAETIDLVRDSTMQGIARSVAAIAANTGGLKNQQLCRRCRLS